MAQLTRGYDRVIDRGGTLARFIPTFATFAITAVRTAHTCEASKRKQYSAEIGQAILHVTLDVPWRSEVQAHDEALESTHKVTTHARQEGQSPLSTEYVQWQISLGCN